MRNSVKLLVESGNEQSVKLGLAFAEPGIEHCVLRITGGCGFLEEKYVAGMDNITEALVQSYQGHILFGGTRMLRWVDPSQVFPGITEVPPAVAKRNKGVRIYGYIPKAQDLKLSPYGLIIDQDVNAQDPTRGWFTVVHPDQNIALTFQPSVDRAFAKVVQQLRPSIRRNEVSVYEAEVLRCMETVEQLHERKFTSALIAYNGGGITKKEVMMWAEAGKRDPRWQVIIVRDSGRACDELASNADFLAEHPTVKVVGNSVSELREAIELTFPI